MVVSNHGSNDCSFAKPQFSVQATACFVCC